MMNCKKVLDMKYTILWKGGRDSTKMAKWRMTKWLERVANVYRVGVKSDICRNENRIC